MSIIILISDLLLEDLAWIISYQFEEDFKNSRLVSSIKRMVE